MLEWVKNLWSPSQYIPHGHCYLWQTPLVGLHVISDALVAISYFSIPAMLLYFVRKRGDLPFSRVFMLFGAFIVLCGLGHLLDIWTLWHPAYWVSGIERALTALVSCYTALQLVELLPQFLALKTPEQLEALNHQLEQQFERRTAELVTANAALESEIVERIAAEAALRQSQEHFSKAFRSNPIACAISTLKDGCFLDVNTSFLTLFGYQREEVIGRTAIELKIWKNQADRNRLMHLLKQQSVQLDAPFCLRSGEVRHGMSSFEKIEIQGEVCLLSMIYDVTDRKQAEVEQLQQMKLADLRADVGTALTEGETLREMLQRCAIALHEYLDAAFARIWILDESQQILTLEASAGMYTHLDGGHCRIPVGQFKIGWIAQHQQPHLTNQVATDPRIGDPAWAKREGMVAFAGYPITIKNRLLGVMAIFARHPLTDRTLKEMAAIASAIAVGIDRKLAALALCQTVEIANAANRAKSEFLSNMSHELRTPLNVILGFTQLLNRDQCLIPEQQKYVQTISDSGEHLLGLINDVLEMSKIEAGRLEIHASEFDLLELLNSLQNMLSVAAIAKGLQFNLEVKTQALSFIRTDKKKLRQILLNLLGNAIKFTPQGSVTLRVSIVDRAGSPGGDPPQSSTAAPAPFTLHFEVEDTGCGIAPEELKQLFQPFRQTRSGLTSTEGTGLGLAISQKYAQLLGGEIVAQSQIGQGSIFSFYASVSRHSPRPSQPTQVLGPVIGLAPGQPIYRVLIAEDNPSNCLLLTQLLGKIGFELKAVSNGQAAIELWQTWQPDLIFMDIRMPIVNGYEATRQIRSLESSVANRPVRTKILALTASIFAEQRAETLAIGCDDFIRKPFKAQEIFEKISQHLNVQYQHQVLSDPVSPRPIDPPQGLEISLLQAMSSDWLRQLHQAALQGDDAKVFKLNQKIPASHSVLIEILTHLAENFQFDQILHVTSQLQPFSTIE